MEGVVCLDDEFATIGLLAQIQEHCPLSNDMLSVLSRLDVSLVDHLDCILFLRPLIFCSKYLTKGACPDLADDRKVFDCSLFILHNRYSWCLAIRVIAAIFIMRQSRLACCLSPVWHMLSPFTILTDVAIHTLEQTYCWDPFWTIQQVLIAIVNSSVWVDRIFPLKELFETHLLYSKSAKLRWERLRLICRRYVDSWWDALQRSHLNGLVTKVGEILGQVRVYSQLDRHSVLLMLDKIVVWHASMSILNCLAEDLCLLGLTASLHRAYRQLHGLLAKDLRCSPYLFKVVMRCFWHRWRCIDLLPVSVQRPT